MTRWKNSCNFERADVVFLGDEADFAGAGGWQNVQEKIPK